MLPILCRTGSFIGHRVFFRQLCLPIPSSSTAPVADIVKAMLPSEAFLEKHVRKPSQRVRLTQRISELHLFFEYFNENAIPHLDDSLWSTYLSLFTVEERCQFLSDLLRANTPMSPVCDDDVKVKISEINQQKYDQNEIVYAPGFHSLIELLGQEFRSKINSMFGSRLLSMERINESMPKLVVDCRFMRDYTVLTQTKFLREIQGLHDGNWTSRVPFNITVANFRPDSQLAENMKRTLLFLFGPPTTSAENKPFLPHPFAPMITPRGVKDAVGCAPERILYVSWRATKFLPPTPPPVDAVVLCASTDFHPSTSSVSAAAHDRLDAYRIPVEQYVRFDGAKRVLPLRKSAAIIRSYFSGDDIGAAIKEAYTSKTPSSQRTQMAADRNKLEAYRHKLEALESERPRLEPRVQDSGRKKSSGQKTHRYSREERNAMRAQA